MKNVWKRRVNAVRERIDLTGMVLKSTSVGEYDRRLVILTRERGKITAFARGAKRPGSRLLGPSRPFAFGTFRLYKGREAYNLQDAVISRYFEELAADVEAACYGQYFLEFGDYCAQENLDGSELLLLIYQSLRALLNSSLPNRLVRRVFELKAMVIGGEYTEEPPEAVSDAAAYAWEYVVRSPMEKLYTFTLTEPVLKEFERCVQRNLEQYLDREFRSLRVLEEVRGIGGEESETAVLIERGVTVPGGSRVTGSGRSGVTGSGGNGVTGSGGNGVTVSDGREVTVSEKNGVIVPEKNRVTVLGGKGITVSEENRVIVPEKNKVTVSDERGITAKENM